MWGDNMERFKQLGKILLKYKEKFIKRKDLLNIPEVALLYFTSNDYSKDIYFKHSARELTRDIQKLNDDADFPSVIISNSYLGVKIATTEEDYKYLQNDKIKTLKSLQRYYNKINKISTKNQLKFDLTIN